MKNKTLVLAFAAAAVMAFCVPASAFGVDTAAKTFTSSDGSLTVGLPSDSWNTIENPNNWITLTDGSSVLTINHFTTGDVLPEPITIVDGDPYVECFQTVFSNKNDIYLFTGTVEEEGKLKDITNIILSASVLKLTTPADTKKDAAPAANQQAAANAEAGMVPEELYAVDGYDPAAEEGMVPEDQYDKDGYDPTADEGMVPEDQYANDGVDPTA